MNIIKPEEDIKNEDVEKEKKISSTTLFFKYWYVTFLSFLLWIFVAFGYFIILVVWKSYSGANSYVEFIVVFVNFYLFYLLVIWFPQIPSIIAYESILKKYGKEVRNQFIKSIFKFYGVMTFLVMLLSEHYS